MLQIRVFHPVDTDIILEVNTKLSNFQREKLDRNLFKWLTHMAEPINISCPLVRELVNWWSPNDQNFRIREYLVPLSGVDVCMGLGLGMSGGEVGIEDNNLGLVSKC